MNDTSFILGVDLDCVVGDFSVRYGRSMPNGSSAKVTLNLPLGRVRYTIVIRVDSLLEQ